MIETLFCQIQSRNQAIVSLRQIVALRRMARVCLRQHRRVKLLPRLFAPVILTIPASPIYLYLITNRKEPFTVSIRSVLNQTAKVRGATCHLEMLHPNHGLLAEPTCPVGPAAQAVDLLIFLRNIQRIPPEPARVTSLLLYLLEPTIAQLTVTEVNQLRLQVEQLILLFRRGIQVTLRGPVAPQRAQRKASPQGEATSLPASNL